MDIGLSPRNRFQLFTGISTEITFVKLSFKDGKEKFYLEGLSLSGVGCSFSSVIFFEWHFMHEWSSQGSVRRRRVCILYASCTFNAQSASHLPEVELQLFFQELP